MQANRVYFDPVDPYLALVIFNHSEQAECQSRFASPSPSHDSDLLAGIDLEIDVVENIVHFRAVAHWVVDELDTAVLGPLSVWPLRLISRIQWRLYNLEFLESAKLNTLNKAIFKYFLLQLAIFVYVLYRSYVGFEFAWHSNKVVQHKRNLDNRAI